MSNGNFSLNSVSANNTLGTSNSTIRLPYGSGMAQPLGTVIPAGSGSGYISVGPNTINPYQNIGPNVGVGNYYMGNWSNYGDYVRTADNHMLNNELFVKCCNKQWVDKLIADKNYTCMITVSDLMLRNNRKLFDRIEKAIMKSNDYTIIGNYFDNARNFSIRHLTQTFLKSVPNEEMDRFSMMARKLIGKLDLRACLSFAKKRRDIRYISWLFSDAYSNIDKHLQNNEINSNNIAYILAKCDNDGWLINATMISEMVPQHLVYMRLKNIKSLEFARQLAENSKEPWAEKLRNFK